MGAQSEMHKYRNTELLYFISTVTNCCVLDSIVTVQAK